MFAFKLALDFRWNETKVVWSQHSIADMSEGQTILWSLLSRFTTIKSSYILSVAIV